VATSSFTVTRHVAGSPPVRRRFSDLARAVRPRLARLFLVLRVYVLLMVMRGVISTVSLRSITARLGTPLEETPRDGVREDQLRYARRVGWAIHGAAGRTPTNSNCYPQALTAWWLLHRKHIPTTFYYGAAFEEDGTALQAHVWVRCGPLIVTGGGPRRRFAPLTWFADIRPPDSPP
jgi:hypothetical protein